jgi:hypothetical protein
MNLGKKKFEKMVAHKFTEIDRFNNKHGYLGIKEDIPPVGEYDPVYFIGTDQRGPKFGANSEKKHPKLHKINSIKKVSRKYLKRPKLANPKSYSDIMASLRLKEKLLAKEKSQEQLLLSLNSYQPALKEEN